MGPLEDAVEVLQEIIQQYPYLNQQPYDFGELRLVFKDGRVFSIGPHPHLRRGKDFRKKLPRGKS